MVTTSTSSPPPRPEALKISARNIPQALKGVPGWVLWRYWWNGKNWTKPPYNVEGVKIDHTDPENWVDYSTALQAYQRGEFDGIGFSLGAMDSLGGADIDHCIKDGKIESWALSIIDELGGYAEVSPSGTGVRVFGLTSRTVKGRKKGDVEMYCDGRYLTVTGHKLDKSASDLVDFAEAFGRAYDRIFPDSPESEEPEDFERGEVGGDLAERFQAFMDDDPIFREKFNTPASVGYRSGAEFHLCAKLWEEGFTFDEIWRLMDSSPQSKWRSREDGYKDRTIRKAISAARSSENDRGRGQGERSDGGEDDEARPITEEELKAYRLQEGPKFENRLPNDHYLTRYIAYGADVSDAYGEYWYAGGLYQLAVIADKKLRVDLRQGTIYPNLYIAISGKSGLSRKTTVVDRSEDKLSLAKPATMPAAVPTEFSPEAFVEHLSEHNHAYWVRDEAAGVLAAMKRDYMRGFKDTLMRLYDCKPQSRMLRTSRKKGEKTRFNVVDPYLNILWATTDAALAKNTEINDTLSGFMARFIYHYPQRPKEKWLPLEEGAALNSALETVIDDHLVKMVRVIEDMEPVALHISREGAAYWNEWQRVRALEMEATNNGDSQQIHSRLVPTVAKLAILFELGSSDFDPSSPIRLEYVVEACRQVDEYYQPTAKAVYDTVGADAEKNVIDRIIRVLKNRGGKATRRELSQQVKIKSKELNEYLSTMEDDETIQIREVQGGRGRPSRWILLNRVGNVDNVDNVGNVDFVGSKDFKEECDERAEPTKSTKSTFPTKSTKSTKRADEVVDGERVPISDELEEDERTATPPPKGDEGRDPTPEEAEVIAAKALRLSENWPGIPDRKLHELAQWDLGRFLPFAVVEVWLRASGWIKSGSKHRDGVLWDPPSKGEVVG